MAKSEKRFVLSTNPALQVDADWRSHSIISLSFITRNAGLLSPSKVALLLGGVAADGFLVGWFKTAKHRFGLHRFGQGTLLGVYRWLVLSGKCLHFGTQEHIYQLNLLIYLTGDKLHKLHFKLSDHNYLCS
ncbi:hypothetical protein [Tolypothrix sp. VBCCA 56010]|uniref:hypothetical protein n=1 Tax=Tolypothrix sp. VBCCA 56010 TaxID=3137731 RepID=UPI003D7C9FD4